MSQKERHEKRTAAMLEEAREYAEDRAALSPTKIASHVDYLFPGQNPYRSFRFGFITFVLYTGRWPNGEECDHPALRGRPI